MHVAPASHDPQCPASPAAKCFQDGKASKKAVTAMQRDLKQNSVQTTREPPSTRRDPLDTVSEQGRRGGTRLSRGAGSPSKTAGGARGGRGRVTRPAPTATMP